MFNYLDKKEIPVYDHPAVSPDLNPCENVFAYLKNYIWAKGKKCKNGDDVYKLANIAL